MRSPNLGWVVGICSLGLFACATSAILTPRLEWAVVTSPEGLALALTTGEQLKLREANGLVFAGSASLVNAYRLRVNGIEYTVALYGSRVHYIEVVDRRFVTPDGLSLGSTYGELLRAGGTAVWEEPGWACFVCLPSQWAAGMAFSMEPNACDSISETSRPKWFFRRESTCRLPLDRGFVEAAFQCDFDSRIREAVLRLSWDSIRYGSEWTVDSEWPTPNDGVASTFREWGRDATPELVAALRDRDRGVAAHLLLCRIYFPDGAWLDGRSVVADALAGYTDYTVLGLTWRHDYDGMEPADGRYRMLIVGEYSVSVEARRENFRRWCKRIPSEFRKVCSCAA
jgi:hypothetical protein